MDREIPFRFEVTNSASELLSEHSGLSEGESSGVTVSVAGRLMLRRDQGKIVFGVLFIRRCRKPLSVLGVFV